MLTILIQGKELYNESTCEFINTEDTTLVLEHSLISISKWEAKWKKSFLSTAEKTPEELTDYIKCMIVNKANEEAVNYLDRVQLNEIVEYMQDSMTATTINRMNQGPPSREVITSELIYCWMVTLGIPFECQKWHINRLLTLIDVCSIKQQPPKKMGRRDAMNQQRSLNAQRRAAMNSKG